MKTYFTKNRVIVLLLAANAVFAYTLFAREKRFSEKELIPPRPAPHAAEFREATLKDDSAIQACYESYLSHGPSVSEGSVVMHWMFNNSGRIENLKLIRSDLDDPSFLECLTDIVRKARMPASDPRAGRLISHTFKFRQKAPAKMEFE